MLRAATAALLLCSIYNHTHVTAPANSLLSFQEARALIDKYSASLPVPEAEPLGLAAATGRFLAEEIRADRDIPPFRRATRDGFAIRSEDSAHLPANLEVLGEIRAGMESPFRNALQRGEAVEIMTGAAVPEGADAVVMVEYTRRASNIVTIERQARAGENWVPQGAEARAGDLLLSLGTRVRAPESAVAASVGKSGVRVYRKPQVAILATGDELVDISLQPAPHQIRNSNTYSLMAQVVHGGGMPVLQPIAPDTEIGLREAVRNTFHCDLLLLTGGVSAGKYDLVERVLQDLGATFAFTGVAIQPGKPLVFGTLQHRRELPFFGLPGNPVSTMVTFDLFVAPVLRALAGGSPQPLAFAHARLKSEFRIPPGLTRFLPAVLEPSLGGSIVNPVRWQGSGDVVSAARSNCYMIVTPERESIAAAEWVPILLRDL